MLFKGSLKFIQCHLVQSRRYHDSRSEVAFFYENESFFFTTVISHNMVLHIFLCDSSVCLALCLVILFLLVQSMHEVLHFVLIFLTVYSVFFLLVDHVIQCEHSLKSF